MSAEAPRDAVVRTVLALERSCLDAEAALVERRWDGINAALAHQQALTAELARLFEAAPDLAPARNEQLARRLRGVLAYRDEQLRRVEAQRDEIAQRLQAIGQVRALSRAVGKHAQTAALLDGQY